MAPYFPQQGNNKLQSVSRVFLRFLPPPLAIPFSIHLLDDERKNKNPNQTKRRSFSYVPKVVGKRKRKKGPEEDRGELKSGKGRKRERKVRGGRSAELEELERTSRNQLCATTRVRSVRRSWAPCRRLDALRPGSRSNAKCSRPPDAKRRNGGKAPRATVRTTHQQTKRGKMLLQHSDPPVLAVYALSSCCLRHNAKKAKQRLRSKQRNVQIIDFFDFAGFRSFPGGISRTHTHENGPGVRTTENPLSVGEHPPPFPNPPTSRWNPVY